MGIQKMLFPKMVKIYGNFGESDTLLIYFNSKQKQQ